MKQSTMHSLHSQTVWKEQWVFSELWTHKNCVRRSGKKGQNLKLSILRLLRSESTWTVWSVFSELWTHKNSVQGSGKKEMENLKRSTLRSLRSQTAWIERSVNCEHIGIVISVQRKKRTKVETEHLAFATLRDCLHRSKCEQWTVNT